MKWKPGMLVQCKEQIPTRSVTDNTEYNVKIRDHFIDITFNLIEMEENIYKSTDPMESRIASSTINQQACYITPNHWEHRIPPNGEHTLHSQSLSGCNTTNF